MKKKAFFDNAHLLYRHWGIVPLLYGSLGLELLTGKDLHADDVDILIPAFFLCDRWHEFRQVLACDGYTLIDEREHVFEKDGVALAYACVEELETFAGISASEIERHSCEHTAFLLLSLEQYQKVYIASAQDGYRRECRQKKDADKPAVIQKHLNG